MAAGVILRQKDQIMSTITGSKYKDFVTAMLPVAAQIKAEFGIAPIITITQAAHESNWGLSELTKSANNLYGFTANKDYVAAKLPTVWRKTNEHSTQPPEKITYWSIPGDVVEKKPDGKGGTWLVVQRPFKSYDGWLSSARDWAQLMKKSRYALALNAAVNGDLVGFAREVAKAGYATDPSYPEKIVKTGVTAEKAMV